MTTPGLEAYDPSRFITDGVYTPDFTVPTPYETGLSKQVAQVFLTSVVAAKVLDWSKLGQQWGKSGFNHQSFAEQVGAVFIGGFKTALVGLLLEGVTHGSSHLNEVAGLSLEPDAALAWAQVYAHQIALGTAVTSARAVEEMVNQGVNQRLPGGAMVERAQAIYGLDAQSANTYTQWASQKTLPKGKTLLELAATLLVRRAKTIGDVNTFTAINQGHQLTYMQAMQDGKIDQDARKVWLTALDERVCPVCKPMDGIAVPVNDSFEVQLPLPKTSRGKNRQSTSVVAPPVHPNCRCTIVLEPTFLAGLITRTARYKDDDNHRSELLSGVEDLLIQKRKQPFMETEHKRDDHGRWAKELNNTASLTGDDFFVFAPDVEAHKFAETWKKNHHKSVDKLQEGVNDWCGYPGVALARKLESGEITPSTWLNKLRGKVARQENMQTLIKTIDAAPANAPLLYRGISLPSQAAVDAIKPGQSMDLPLSSYSENPEMAAYFSGATGQRLTKKGKAKVAASRNVIFVVEPGSQALNISPLASMAAWRAQEWVGRGQYVVTQIEKPKPYSVGFTAEWAHDAKDGKVQATTVHIKQVGVSKAMSEDTLHAALLCTPLPALPGEFGKAFLEAHQAELAVKVIKRGPVLRDKRGRFAEVGSPRDHKGRFDLHPAKIDQDIKRWLTDEHTPGSLGSGLHHIRSLYHDDRKRTPVGRLYNKKASPTTAPIYRGITIPKDPRIGSTMSFTLSSFTTDPKVAHNFARNGRTRGEGTPTVLRVLPGIKGLRLEPYYNRRTDTFMSHRRKKEVIAAGRVRVVGVYYSGGTRIVEARPL